MTVIVTAMATVTVCAMTNDSETPPTPLDRLDALLDRRDGVAHALTEAVLNLDDVTARSYLHPNGFMKIPLTDPTTDPDGMTLRLHVWPARSPAHHPEALRQPGRDGDRNPHNHRFDFASAVLLGRMRDVHYDEVPLPQANSPRHVRHEYGGTNTRGALTAGPLTTLQAAVVYERRTGDRYTLARDVVHTVHPQGDQVLVTLVMQGPFITDTAIVYGTPGEDVDRPGAPLTEDVVYRQLVSCGLAATFASHNRGDADR